MDYVAILNVGVIGLGFLLAVLAYSLLKTASDRRAPYFLIFSLLVVGAGLGSEYMRRTFDADLASLRNELKASQDEISRLKQQMAEKVATSESDFAARSEIISKLLVDLDDGAKDLAECVREASGASTNTSDAEGCTRAAFAAAGHGRDAVTKIQNVRGRIEGLK